MCEYLLLCEREELESDVDDDVMSFRVSECVDLIITQLGRDVRLTMSHMFNWRFLFIFKTILELKTVTLASD